MYSGQNTLIQKFLSVILTLSPQQLPDDDLFSNSQPINNNHRFMVFLTLV